MKVATLILNRNLPIITDKLFNKIKRKNKIKNDIFVIESGSDKINYQRILLGGLIGIVQKKMV